MLTKITKSVSVGILLFAGMLWHYAANDQLLFGSIVCAGSILAVYHAIRAQKRLLAWEFLGVALLFNPLVPIFRPADNLSLLAVWISIALIVTSLVTFKTQPLLSIPSITDCNPRSQSL
jgi:hypothetical protein